MKFSSPIITFMIASAGIHAGVVMTSNSAANITLPGSTGSVMAVKIKEHKTPSTKKQRHKVIKEITSNKLAQKIVTSEITKPISKNKIDESISSVTESQQAESKARVISVIYKELNQYFNYPKLAQKHNWQGKVLLSLRISSDGIIDNIKLDNSSGYSVLDQAAINSLIKLGSLPQVSSWLPYDVELKLPVIYQLTKG